jgi:hypothetical protein
MPARCGSDGSYRHTGRGDIIVNGEYDGVQTNDFDERWSYQCIQQI